MGDRLLLVLMIDALGARMVRETAAFDFLPHRETPLRSICGYSSACIPSLLTGLSPTEHGHWAMYLRDPRRSIFRAHRWWIPLVADALGRDGLARRILTRLLARSDLGGYYSLYDIPPRLLPQFDLCEKRDIYAAGGFDNGETPFDVAARLAVPHRVWSWRGAEAQRRAGLAAAIREGRDAFLFFYSPLLDAMGHAQGTRSREFRDCLEEFAGFAREMRRLASEHYDEVRTLVFGDHGMADVTATYDLYGELRALPHRVPQDLLYFLDSTMARFWFFRPGLREELSARLSAKPYGRILSDEECRELGILFPDRRYGELIFLTDPGAILVPSFMGRDAPRAMHGYHPADEDSDTILLTDFAHAAVGGIRGIGPLIKEQIRELASSGASGGVPEREENPRS